MSYGYKMNILTDGTFDNDAYNELSNVVIGKNNEIGGFSWININEDKNYISLESHNGHCHRQDGFGKIMADLCAIKNASTLVRFWTDEHTGRGGIEDSTDRLIKNGVYIGDRKATYKYSIDENGFPTSVIESHKFTLEDIDENEFINGSMYKVGGN